MFVKDRKDKLPEDILLWRRFPLSTKTFHNHTTNQFLFKHPKILSVDLQFKLIRYNYLGSLRHYKGFLR